MIRVKLELQTLEDEEIINLGTVVAGKLDGNANFPAPPVAPDTLTDDAEAMNTLINERTALLEQAQQKTLQIRLARNKLEADLNATGGYVESVINKVVPPATSVDPVAAAEKARSAGLDVESDRSPVGPMPKVSGLTATQGDSDGEIDLQWNSIKRGLQSYVAEVTDDPTGQTGWRTAYIGRKSSASISGLESGKRHWFRVAAIGAEGQGPWSEPATKVAP